MLFRDFGAFSAAFLTAAALTIPSAAAAQGPEGPGRVARQTPSAPAATPVNKQDAEETRRQFNEVLSQYPPSLGRVMRLDPTLMTNENYLASYPNVAAFLAQYPDIARNPGFYLERYDPNFQLQEPTDARRQALKMWEEAIEFFGAFAVFCAVVLGLFVIVRYVVEYRRWSRVSKVNAEVHNKILDRFGSNEELLAYIDSPAGRRFLEATPIAPSAAPARSVGAPYGRILLSVQVGLILIALGVGFLVIAGRAIDEVQPVITALSVLAFCLGIGSVASAGASYVLSHKLGLLSGATDAGPERP